MENKAMNLISVITVIWPLHESKSSQSSIQT